MSPSITHLPAPFRIEGDFDAEVSVTLVSADGTDICELYPASGNWGPREIGTARLFEMSPRLLVVLRSVLENAVMPEGVRLNAMEVIADAEKTQ